MSRVRRRVLWIGLDGFDAATADRLMADGRLPRLAALARRAARVDLDHGPAKRTGLAWEHVATGLAPGRGGRWSAVHFDSRRYVARQDATKLPPFAAALDARTVVFDAPYFDLARAPRARGLVAWGAHDPGVPPLSSPSGLADEVRGRFGEYPAPEWIYGFTWPSPENCGRLAEALAAAARKRADVAEWLLAERLPDWDLAYVVSSELHSASEPLWHGLNPAHPLHDSESACAAGEGLVAVYQAVDEFVGRLADRFPDAALLAFSMHGMGDNHADVAAMILLPELMYRWSTGRTALRNTNFPTNARGVPLLPPDGRWEDAVLAHLDRPLANPSLADRIRSWFTGPEIPQAGDTSLDWMPGALYRPAWPRMKAFALPAFYDGQIRINLKGREARGRVALRDYNSLCDELERVLRTCRDPVTGAPAVAHIERPAAADPLGADPTQCDLLVVWRDCPLGLEHPDLGRIGPLPYRRTGGHTGDLGVAWVAGHEMASGCRIQASSFDVTPSVFELLGERAPSAFSGASFLDRIAR